MLAEERQRMILELLEEKGAVSVAELCRQTAASEATVRRDLNELDRQGRLSKVHGGAVLPEEEFDGRENDIPTKLMLYAEEKRRIAKYAAAQVKDEDFVFIDAGSTTLGMADFLQHSKATFVTNGIECAGRLAQKGLRVYLTGGYTGACGSGSAGIVEEISLYQSVYRNQRNQHKAGLYHPGHRGGVYQVHRNRAGVCQVCVGRFQ